MHMYTLKILDAESQNLAKYRQSLCLNFKCVDRRLTVTSRGSLLQAEAARMLTRAADARDVTRYCTSLMLLPLAFDDDFVTPRQLESSQ